MPRSFHPPALLLPLLLSACGEADPTPSEWDPGWGETSPPGGSTWSGTPPGDADADGFDAPDDCDDGDPTVNPSAEERCDGIDNDCDGITDEDAAVDAPLWYADLDSDGFGDRNHTLAACLAPFGYVADATDCDDLDGGVHPSATEVCDGRDNDCDGLIDDASASGAPLWYPDDDGDGYGADEGVPLKLCIPPSDYVDRAGDCDDTDATITPAATEICGDGIDNDCDEAAVGCPLTGVALISDADGAWLAEAPGDLDGLSISTFSPGLTPLGLDIAVTGLLIGAPDHDSGAGAVYAVTDAAGTLDAATLRLSAGGDGDGLGRAVAGADLDGDGTHDILASAPGADDDAGGVYLLSGPLTTITALDDAMWLSGEADAMAGAALAAGDVGGDGVADLLIGSCAGAGAWLLTGPITADRALDDARVAPGCAADIAPDIDGDGLDDLVLGEDDAALIVSGPALGETTAEDAAARLSGVDGAGATVLGAGDLDGDGYGDVLIGGTAGVWVARGPLSGDIDLDTVSDRVTGAPGGRVGAALAAAGDVDDDGRDDALIGAPGDSDPENDSYPGSGGQVGLFLGPISGALSIEDAHALVLSEAEDAELGMALSAGTNLLGLSGPVLVLGAAAGEAGDVGAVHVLSGVDP